MIFYFSGTGNSAYIAKKIAGITGDSILSMNERIRKKDISEIHSENSLVFVVPTYAWRIPRVAEEWIRRTSFMGNPRAYFVMSCGGSIGNAGKYLRRLCEQKKWRYMGAAEIVMPENYIALYEAPKKEEAIRIIEQAEPSILAAADNIRKEAPFPGKTVTLKDKIDSSLVNDVFYPLIVKAKQFRAEDTCTGCGRCVKECPLNNISLKDKKPVWGNTCTHCMACICKCPAEAIEYGTKSVNKVRYQCPR